MAPTRTDEPREVQPGARSVSGTPDRDIAVEDLVLRASALEGEGAWEEAAGVYDQLFQSALDSHDVRRSVDALRWQARVRGQQRRFEEAEELADLCREIASRNGLQKGAARAMHLLAMFSHEQGDLDSAFPRYSAALEQAREIGDDQLIGFICQNLGVLANMRGDLRGARVLYLESIAATIASQDESNLTMTYNNLGMVCTDLREWLEAEVYFDRGIEVARRRDDRAQLARLYANRAEPFLRTADLKRAAASLDEADRHASEFGAASTSATIACLRAAAARLEGDLVRADRHLDRALEIARENDLALAEAEALEELARLRRAQGRLGEASSEAVAAQAIFRRIGAARDAANVTMLLDELEGPQT